MNIKDKKLLKETFYNFLKNHNKWLFMFLVAIITALFAVAQGIGLDKIMDYIYILLITVILFIISLIILVLAIYKRNLDEKIKKQKEYKELVYRCEKWNK